MVSLVALLACASTDPDHADPAESPADTAETPADTAPEDTSAGVSWRDDVYDPWLHDACGDCHIADGYIHPPITGDASPLVGVASTAGMPYVTAGDHEQSFLWYKVNDRQGEVAETGTRMPPPDSGKDPLGDEALAALKAWIDGGALP
jgi:hypothetical protein